MLDFGDFVDMLEGDLADELMTRVLGATDAILARFHVGRLQQQISGGGSTEVEGKGTVGADSDTRRNGDTGVNVCSSGVEFLQYTISALHVLLVQIAHIGRLAEDKSN